MRSKTRRAEEQHPEFGPEGDAQSHHDGDGAASSAHSHPPQPSLARSRSSRTNTTSNPYAVISQPSQPSRPSPDTSLFEDGTQTQSHLDVHEHLAVDPSGNIEARGPTNTLYESSHWHKGRNPEVPEHYASAILTATTALEQQREIGYKKALLDRGHIEGVPAELALHLLDIHWSRHHFFLISYRPAFYRDMMSGGPYYSPLLLFAILAVSSRYSERSEVGGGDHSAHSGKGFYDKAHALLAEDMERSTIPTATALLLMGNALVSGGKVDKGWLYTGWLLPTSKSALLLSCQW